MVVCPLVVGPAMNWVQGLECWEMLGRYISESVYRPLHGL